MIRKSTGLGCVAVLALGIAACAPLPESDAPAPEVSGAASSRVVDTGVIASAADPGQWLTHGGTYLEQRYSALAAVNAQNVEQLGLAWHFDFDTHRGQESTPLIVGETMYVTSAWSKVFALNAATGEELWRYDPEVPGIAGYDACCDVVNRGAAYYRERVYVGTIDGRLIALDAGSGEPVWSVQTTARSLPYTITGAPRAAKGKVFIGNGGAEYGVRGYVSAYDAHTGDLIWRFYTVPGERGVSDGAASDDALARLAQPTWYGDDYVAYGGGGTVWDSIVYDPDFDQLYFGVGNGSPWNRQIRSQGRGDNLFLSSIVAVNPDTGEYLWHYQETPGETWDYTATQQITLATLTLDGVPTPVLMHAPKNGFFYLLERGTGKLLSAEKFVPANWAERIDLATGRPVEAEGSRFESEPFASTVGGAGAHNWQPMAFDPDSGLVFIPAQQVPFVYTPDTAFEYRPGEWNLGVNLTGVPLPEDDASRKAISGALEGRLIAWDPVAQREVWRVDHDAPWNGGTLATAGGLVFQGLTDQTFRAYRATDGALLWQYPMQDAVITAPVSYRVNGEQYVAVTVGNGGGMPLTLPTFDGPKATPNGRVVAFKLGGEARLPPHVHEARPVVTDVPELDPQRTDDGFQIYGRHCSACHGIETLTAGVLPDLRRSPSLANADLWHAVVLGGALEANGMRSFADKITKDDAELLRRYVGEQARKYAAWLRARESLDTPGGK